MTPDHVKIWEHLRRQSTENLMAFDPSGKSQIIAECDALRAELRCPINLDDNRGICSAGVCHGCLGDRVEGLSNDLAAVTAERDRLREAIKITIGRAEHAECSVDDDELRGEMILISREARAALTPATPSEDKR